MSENEILAAAREKWPGIDSPDIRQVNASSLTIAILDKPLEALPWREDELPPIKKIRIELEPVGRWMMGYEPRSNTLAVRPLS